MENISCFMEVESKFQVLGRSSLGSWLSRRRGKEARGQGQPPAVILALLGGYVLADGAVIDVCSLWC